jgi:hypothetical protein
MILVTNTFEARRSPVRYDPQSRLSSRVKPASSSLPHLRCHLFLQSRRTLIQPQIPKFQVFPNRPLGTDSFPNYFLHTRIGDIHASSNFSTTLRQARGSCDEFRSRLYYEFIFKNSSHADLTLKGVSRGHPRNIRWRDCTHKFTYVH